MEVAFTSDNDTISMAMANGSLLSFRSFSRRVCKSLPEQATETHLTSVFNVRHLLGECFDPQCVFCREGNTEKYPRPDQNR